MGRRRPTGAPATRSPASRAPGSPTSRALTVLAVLGAYLGVVATAPSARSWPTAASVATMMMVPATLGAAAFAWAGWRLSVAAGVSAGWRSAATALRRLPRGLGRLVASVLLWTVSAGLAGTALTRDPGWAVLTATAGLTATVLMTGVGVDLLLLAAREERSAVLSLERQLSALRDRTRAEVEQLHEVKGTIAGLASASALISGERRLSAPERERLTQMLTAETARLHRMFAADRDPAGPTVADLDEIVRPVVLAHRVQGQDVEWHPPAHRVLAPVDPLAEVVNILLHNAAEHAAGAPVTIAARSCGDRTAIVVSDLGPGIAEDRRHRVFDWGWRGPDSRGRGVGLAIAAEAIASIGGTLRLAARQGPGATFVVELPDGLGADRDLSRARSGDRSDSRTVDHR